MNFNKRFVHRKESIAKSDTGVGQGARVDQEAIDTFVGCQVNTVNQNPFMVALKKIHFDQEFSRKRL
jgi:hypothetical protein